MENVEVKAGFRVARTITIIFIVLLAVLSFAIFGHFQKQSKHLLDSYLAYVSSMGPKTFMSTIFSAIYLTF
jgi:hypothetical protein